MQEAPSSSLYKILLPALDKIVKSASWRRHVKLVQDCKTVMERLASSTANEGSTESPLFDGSKRLPASDAEFLLQPLLLACEMQSSRVTEPALDCFEKLILGGHLVGEIGAGNELQPESSLILRVVDAICKCQDMLDETIELQVLKTLLTAVVSPELSIHGDNLLKAINTCYKIFLVTKSNQLAAKATMAQILVVSFKRMEADSTSVALQPMTFTDLIENEKSKASSSSNPDSFVQNLIQKVAQDIDGVLHSKPVHDDVFTAEAEETSAECNGEDVLKAAMDADISMYKDALENRRSELELKGADLLLEFGNKFRRDGYLVFRALCKLSIRAPSQEGSTDLSIRSKVLALELLKVVLENAGPFFCTNSRFLKANKQYLCKSILQNCAESHILSVFQISCSIFLILIAKFRAPLKTEIGVFFPMIILRVLENVNQPNYQQKMTVLCCIEKLSDDPQVLADTFLNYDCDVDSPNIFERIVNGLLKSAQGPTPGSDTGLTASQEATMKLASLKCLVKGLKAVGDWMDRQLMATAVGTPKTSYTETGGQQLPPTTPVDIARTESPTGNDTQLESSSEATSESGMTFEQRRVYKLELQEAIALFNQKPRQGIDHLVKAKRLQETPEDVAKFLLNTIGLDKGLIGDYLGSKDDFPLRVMHAYIDSFNFHKMDFDEAIRKLLLGFRLPGEAQKIDRIMEKFAERYCICNPKAFSSADTAYILAYSVIMLNTDAHNPTVKEKMSKAAFIKNNRGIDNGKDLPEEFISALYDRIVRKEIKMKADVASPPVVKATSKDIKFPFPVGIDNILNIVLRKPKEERLFQSSEEAIQYMQEQIKQKTETTTTVYYVAMEVEIVKPMVEASWAPMLAGLSVVLDKTEEEVITLPCLEGFKQAIRITAVMYMPIQRDAFITSLAKFTSLHSPADIKEKNVAAMKIMLGIAEDYGNYLQNAWEHVLTCVSRFQQLHLIGEGALPDATFFSNEPDKKLANTNPKKKGRYFAALATRRTSYDSTQAKALPLPAPVTQEQISTIVSHLSVLGNVGENEVNKIFTRSPTLSSDAIVDFVKALCKVALDELRAPTDPRVFSLTKIVEIAHFNMNRIRLVWNRMWNVLSDFFVDVGCSGNLSVAMYSMDSLRQLAMKFMDREELANYNFQNQFMRPFAIIMQRSGSLEIREFIIRCVSQMVCTRVSSVKSGWKITFMVFTTAATDQDAGIVHLAFEAVETIVRDYFQHITEFEITIFTDCVNCLLAFICNKFNDDISLNAISFLRFCASQLAQGELGPSSGIVDSRPDTDDHLYFWFPLLAGLSEVTSDSRAAVRESAARNLFDILKCHGHLFTLQSWEQILDAVLFPLFDYQRRAIKVSGIESEEETNAWLYEACTLALQLLVDLITQYFWVLSPLLPKILGLFSGFLRRHHDKVAAITIACFVRLVVMAGPQFENENWAQVLDGLKNMTIETFPNAEQIVVFSEQECTTENDFVSEYQLLLSELKYHTTVQMLLVQAVKEIYDAYATRIAPAQILHLLGVLNAIVGHSHRVNSDLALRSKIQSLQLSTQMSDPPLLRLESDSSHVYMEILQKLHVDNPKILLHEDVETRFVEFCEEVLKVYLDVSINERREKNWVIPLSSIKKRELIARAPLVVMALQAVSKFRGTPFQKHLSRFFLLLASLISCEHGSVEVQLALSDLFSQFGESI